MTTTAKVEKWLTELDGINRDRLKVNAGRAALIIVDMQNYFLKKGAPAYLPEGEKIIPNVRSLIKYFRTSEQPVIFTRHVHHPDGRDAGIMGWWWSDMIVEGSPESEIHADLAPFEDEKVIHKHRYSAFYETELETSLRERGVEDLVIAGVMTNLCCESTARDAFYRNYRVFFPADATATVNEDMHRASLLNLAYGFAVITSVSKITSQMQN